MWIEHNKTLINLMDSRYIRIEKARGMWYVKIEFECGRLYEMLYSKEKEAIEEYEKIKKKLI